MKVFLKMDCRCALRDFAGSVTPLLIIERAKYGDDHNDPTEQDWTAAASRRPVDQQDRAATWVVEKHRQTLGEGVDRRRAHGGNRRSAAAV